VSRFATAGSAYPPGLIVRSPMLPGVGPGADGPDVDAAFTVMATAETALLGALEVTREEARAQLAGSHIDRDRSRLVFEHDRPVGLLTVEVDHDGREVSLDAYVVPAAPAGLLTALVADAVAGAAQIARAAPPMPDRSAAGGDETIPDGGRWEADAGAFAQDDAYARALHGNEFRPVRRFWRMRIDLAEHGITGGQVPAPAGVAVVPADRDPVLRSLHEVHTEAFAEHWGTTPREYEAWLARLTDRSGTDRSRWWLATVDGRPAGLCIVDATREDLGEAYIPILGVVPWARGRGVAAWLLRLAFAEAANRGLAAVTLNVDSENHTGATRLYERVGMSAVAVIDAWRRPLP
jgi:ribosomal protein S18 acetylase RimI-like enzyme